MAIRRLEPYEPDPDEELVEMDPDVVLPEGVTLMPGVKVYVSVPKGTLQNQEQDGGVTA